MNLTLSPNAIVPQRCAGPRGTRGAFAEVPQRVSFAVTQ